MLIVNRKIIRKSLEDLKYVRTLAPKIQTIILDALVNSTEVAFGKSLFADAVTYAN